MVQFTPVLADLFNPETIRQGSEYVRGLSEEDRAIVMTWLWFEGLGRMLYYVLVFLAVFLLGRRIIQALIAGYREARAQSV